MSHPCPHPAKKRSIAREFARRLSRDPSWQAILSPEERRVWTKAAELYFRQQRRAGLDLHQSYRRVLAMLQEGVAFEEREAQRKAHDSSPVARGQIHDGS